MSPNLTALAYLAASVLFVLALRGLSSPDAARRGNVLGMAGMAIAIVTTVVNDPNYVTNGFVISSHVKEEIDLSKWTPRPCDVPPRVFRSGRAQ